MGFKMQGVDLSRGSIDAAGQKASILGFRDVSFAVADAESLAEVSDESVDGVVSFSALRYVPDLKRALLAIRRVLKPGGAAVLDFPNRFCPWFKVLKTRFGVERHIHDQHYSTREIVTLLRDAGLADVAARRNPLHDVCPARAAPASLQDIDWGDGRPASTRRWYHRRGRKP
jgi:ubiquinone/menaquinone biosynthesis C-methylase UbiE